MTSRVYVMTFLVVLGLSAVAQAQTFTRLYSFNDADGAYPAAGLIQDLSGNLYGTTSAGGGDLDCSGGWGCGVVFKLNTAGTETMLHTFTGPPDGADPETPVVRDGAGNIYGTTFYGGSSSDCDVSCGIVFKIDAAGKEKVLHSFTGGLDGCNPGQGLVLDKSGTVFGTAGGCGASDHGTIFNIDSAGKFTILHSFAGQPSDGWGAWGGHLTMDKSGNLYGVTTYGGAYNWGTLYKLDKSRKLALLHSFNYGITDGCEPYGSVVQDESGNFYGTTYGCGSYGYGTIWKVSKKGKETILHNFAGGASDGCNPEVGVTRDSKGNLYGDTVDCGADNWGVLYELSADGQLTLLHTFDDLRGVFPEGEVWLNAKGELYGTAAGGGEYGSGYGTVWEYVP